MKKTGILISLILTAGAALTACGSSEPEETVSGMTVTEDLSLETVVVDDFDESLYSVDELGTMMKEEAAEYNSENGEGRVTAGDATVNDGKVSASMDYASAEDYAAFNSRYFKIEKLSDFISGGSVIVSFKNVKDGSSVDITTLEGDDLYILVTDESQNVEFPGKIQCISDGVTALSKKTVLIDDDMDGLAYIVFTNK